MADTLANIVRQLRRPLNRRWSVNWLAALIISTEQVPCIVEDISGGGAKLRVGRLPESEAPVTLVIVNYEPIAGLVAWRSGDRIGLKFGEQQPVIEELLLKAAKQAVGSVLNMSHARRGTLTKL